MKLSLGKSDVSKYIARQLNHSFPDKDVTGDQLAPYLETALERAEYCFSRIANKYFSDGNQTYFNHLHTDQYAMLLYFLGNSIYRVGGDLSLATRTYALNKALHSIDAFYEVDLPDVFYFQHPVGTVLGRAKYSDCFVVYQHCTVGAGPELSYPDLSEGVIMYGGSAIIGECTVGSNCWLSAGTIAINQDLPSNSVIFGRSPNIVAKATERNILEQLFALSIDG